MEPVPGDGARLEQLLRPRQQLTVHVSTLLIAQALWDYGEDQLSERALGMSEDEHAKIERIAAWYEDPAHPLPLVDQHITHNHVNAFAAITLFEGRVRPLVRSRRRPARDRPEVFRGPTSPS